MDNIKVLEDRKILEYPFGISGSDKDGLSSIDRQYMIFKINTDEKTTKLRNDISLGRVIVPDTRVGTGIASNILTPGGVSSKDADRDLVIQNGQSGVDAEKFRVQKGMVRLDKVIVLPMPSDHQVSTRISYSSDTESSTLTKFGDAMNQSGSAVASELLTLGKNAGIGTGINSIVKSIGASNDGITSTRALLAEERLAINPKKEVMFKDLGFREFSFNWTFAPKSYYESFMVQRIIESFRYYALPEISPGKLFYIFPSEFEIQFMLGQKINPTIPKITTSVLQNVSVRYSRDGGSWASLPDGSAAAIDIRLDFLELEMIDRKRVYNADSTITGGF